MTVTRRHVSFIRTSSIFSRKIAGNVPRTVLWWANGLASNPNYQYLYRETNRELHPIIDEAVERIPAYKR